MVEAADRVPVKRWLHIDDACFTNMLKFGWRSKKLAPSINESTYFLWTGDPDIFFSWMNS